jgi:hypothetical protein
MQTTKDKILNAPLKGERLTEFSGLNDMGITCLRSRISDLRREGVNISDQFVKSANGKRFKEYFIPKEQQQTFC